VEHNKTLIKRQWRTSDAGFSEALLNPRCMYEAHQDPAFGGLWRKKVPGSVDRGRAM
jgi:hypothetical protein